MKSRSVMLRKWLSLIPLVLAAALFIFAAGCGSKKMPEPGPNQIWIIGWNFIPGTITVPVGTTVTWKNTTLDYHEVTSDDKLFNARVDAGASYNYTFTMPGTFVFHDTSTDPEAACTVIVQ